MKCAFKCVFQSGLLQEYILLQPFHFLINLNNTIAFIHSVTQYLRERIYRIADFILVVVNRHPVNGIQRVIQEMRINLCFQSGDFGVILSDRRYFFTFHRIVQFLYHLVELIGDRFYFYRHMFIRFNSYRQLTLLGNLHCLDYFANRSCQTICDENNNDNQS